MRNVAQNLHPIPNAARYLGKAFINVDGLQGLIPVERSLNEFFTAYVEFQRESLSAGVYGA